MDGWGVAAFSILLSRLLLAFIYWHLARILQDFLVGFRFLVLFFWLKK
ncbi:MAG: hypothetical protein IKD25_09025 [Bacteroidaceae bacterium]|nr:hypothetical protein [Bacteroidaceae bacterium]